jgi:hypothetical protein
VASTAELHREEAEAEKRRAADLAAGARLLRLAWMEATGWRALLLLLAPAGAGREARRAGGVRGRWEATSFFCFFFSTGGAALGARQRCRRPRPPGNAACRRPPLILQATDATVVGCAAVAPCSAFF